MVIPCSSVLWRTGRVAQRILAQNWRASLCLTLLGYLAVHCAGHPDAAVRAGMPDGEFPNAGDGEKPDDVPDRVTDNARERHPRATTAASPPTAIEIARQIDRELQQAWQREGVTAELATDDYEFLRRATLDFVGTVPTVGAIRQFVAEEDPDKRLRLIDRLLESPQHATHLANTWRHILLPNGFDQNTDGAAFGMQRWLRDRFATNVRYDRIVGDFVTATGSRETGPVLFYDALDTSPEKLASSTARCFLGIQLQCAQCHDHPFDDWTQEQFWQYAAFFARVQGSQGMGQRTVVLQDVNSGEVTIPGTNDIVLPAFPGDSEMPVDPNGARRLQLSSWLASGDNPFLARATVNRVWWHLMGRGLVHPVDDMSLTNDSSHPAVLKLLEQFFVSSRFDLRELYRAVGYSIAYSRPSRSQGGNTPSPDAFAVMALKPLSAEQLFDSMAIVLQQNDHLTSPDIASNSLANPVRQTFLDKMATSGNDRTGYTSGLQQTFFMMNNPTLVHLAEESDMGILAALDAPFLNDAQRIEVVFLATVGRLPDPTESQRLSKRMASHGRNSALADLLWALVNSAEFQLNH